MVNEAKQKPPRRYEKMRDSGVAWIGMVPEGWTSFLLGQLVKQVKNKNVLLQERNLLSLSYGKIKRKDIETAEGLVPASYDGYNIIEKGDIVLRLTDLQNDHTSLRVGLATERGIITSAYLTLRPLNSVFPAFLYYALHTFDVRKGFYGMGAGVRQGLKYDEIRQIKVVLPALIEQHTIANFLDKKCSEIDAIIADAKASIEEYKAWKASIIYEAVTKGLDPHAEMKDSGVEWIGEIPEEWYVCKTLFVLQMPITDGPHTTPELYAAGVPFVSAEAVSCGNGRIDFNHIRGYISEGFYQECCKKYIPQKDDIYMIKSGATTGKVAIVDVDTKFTIWSPLAAFRVNPKKVLPRYLFYFLQSPAYQKQVELGWSFGTQQNIGMRTLEKLKICVPPLSVQQEIIRYLDEKSNKLDAIIKEKTDLISDLESYKKSLIYEVVTGKRKVI